MIKEKILVVEDEKSISSLICAILKNNNFDVISCASAGEAANLASSHCPDLIILDLGLPDFDGIKLLEMIRTWSNVPVIVVSARFSERDKIEAFEKGADDYITKPFGSGELLARIRVALKHSHASTENSAIKSSGKYSVGDLVIDYDKHIVLVNNEDVHLTVNEFKIVAFLGQYAGKVLTYDTILKKIWGPASGSDNQILRVNMANIRRKIEQNPAQPKYIATVVGVGYRLLDS